MFPFTVIDGQRPDSWWVFKGETILLTVDVIAYRITIPLHITERAGLCYETTHRDSKREFPRRSFDEQKKHVDVQLRNMSEVEYRRRSV